MDKPEYAWSMGQTTGAKFEILSDVDHKVIESYRVFNASEHGGIAFPSTFIIDKGGRIRVAYVGQSATDRPTDGYILTELKKVVSQAQD